MSVIGLPWWLRWWRIGLQCRRPRFHSWVGRIPWRREWLPTSVVLPGEFHGQRSLAGYNPWGHKESDVTEWLTFSFFSYLVNVMWTFTGTQTMVTSKVWFLPSSHPPKHPALGTSPVVLVVKTPTQCKQRGFNPGWGTKIPQAPPMWTKKMEKKKTLKSQLSYPDLLVW